MGGWNAPKKNLDLSVKSMHDLGTFHRKNLFWSFDNLQVNQS